MVSVYVCENEFCSFASQNPKIKDMCPYCGNGLIRKNSKII